MDWSTILSNVMDGVVSVGVIAATGLIARYTGYQVSAAQQATIKDKATQLAHQAIAAAAPGIEQAVIHVTDPIVQNKVPQMISDLASHGITISADKAADNIQAAFGAAQVAAPTVDVSSKV